MFIVNLYNQDGGFITKLLQDLVNKNAVSKEQILKRVILAIKKIKCSHARNVKIKTKGRFLL